MEFTHLLKAQKRFRHVGENYFSLGYEILLGQCLHPLLGSILVNSALAQ